MLLFEDHGDELRFVDGHDDSGTSLNAKRRACLQGALLGANRACPLRRVRRARPFGLAVRGR